jgi:hypothetical protein
VVGGADQPVTIGCMAHSHSAFLDDSGLWRTVQLNDDLKSRRGHYQ